MSSSQWYTTHCAACQGHDLIGRPCRGRQIPLQPDDGFWFTVDSLAAALLAANIREYDQQALAAAIIKAAKEADRD